MSYSDNDNRSPRPSFRQLNDALFDALHDFALATLVLDKRRHAIAVLVACFELADRFPSQSRSAIAVNRLTVLPYVSRHGMLLYIAERARRREAISDALVTHLFKMVERAADTIRRERLAVAS